MRGRFLARAVAAGCGLFLTLLLAPARPTPADPPPAPKAGESDMLFGTTQVWSIQLEIPAKEYDAMQPASGRRLRPTRRRG